MAFVHEIQIKSTGFPGAPGYTNLYFACDILDDGFNQFFAVGDFINTYKALFPAQWQGTIQASGRVLEETTGLLAKFTTCPVELTSPRGGGGSANFGSGVSGLVLAWQTATINRSRLVRGRTFMVPVANDVYDADGTLSAGRIAQATTAAQALVAANVGFGIWSRPVNQAGGKLAPVTGYRVNDRAAFLSSRRA